MKLNPSSCSRRAQCPGSAKLEFEHGVKPDYSIYAKEGNVMHEIAKEILKNARDLQGFFNKAVDNIIITQEMLDCVKLYIDHILSIKKNYGLCVEEKLEINFYDERIPLVTGYVDAYCVDLANNTINIWDFKTGYTPVNVFENLQLLYYAKGILQKREDLLLVHPKEWFISFHIVQPRSYATPAISTWTISFDGFTEYEKQLRKIELTCFEENAKLIPGNECRYCTARIVCPALKYNASQVAEMTNKNLFETDNPETTGNELYFLKKSQEILSMRISILEEQVKNYILNNQNVPYFTLKKSYSRQKWVINNEEIKNLEFLFNVSLLKEPEPVTPKQAIVKGVDEDIVNKYSKTEEYGYQLKLTENFFNE